MADTNPYIAYYTNQAGTGISPFYGVPYQKGHGFFGRLFSNVISPALKYIGRAALQTGVNIGSDVLEGQNLKQAATDRLKEAGKTAANKALIEARNALMKQQGSGLRRPRGRVTKRRKCIKARLPTKKRKTTTKRGPQSKRNKRITDPLFP